MVVPFGNANALAAEIEKLLANPELCRTMGWCGQEKALGDEDTRGRRICEEFEHLVGAVGAKGRRQHSVPPAMIPDSIGRNDRPDQAKPGKYKSRPWVREL